MKLICPVCGAGAADLDQVCERGCPCKQCGFTLRKADGIVRALPPERSAFYERFLDDYSTIRNAEGRGSTDPEYYRALPYQDLSGKNSEQWRIRGCTYRYFESNILERSGLDILDIGAGNGWMSHRLTQRGDRPVAVDIFTDALDGLAAGRKIGTFPAVEAEFDHLPFADGQFDLAVFNCSFHYSTDYRATLLEAGRCLKPSGSVVILDTPLYKLREHGERMRAERHEYFRAKYGFPSDSVASLEFLHEAQLGELSRDLQLRWQIYQPWYGWKWYSRPWKARMLGRRPPSRFCILEGELFGPMIILLNPRATKPKNRRYPLSLLAIGAVLEGKEEYTIVDGNVDDLKGAEPWSSPGGQKPELLAVTVMPGPQMVAAIPLCRAFKAKYPDVPVVWGGYFPSLYPDASLNASYVDFVVRGQGEDTFIELLAALRGSRDFSKIRGLSYTDAFGMHVNNPERPMQSPGDFPWYPYHRLDPEKYLHATFLGSRTTVHQASIGCPFRCNFCGVVPVFDREKIEPPERTAGIMAHLQREYGVNAVQFYDNNFFLREDHTRELAERMKPLGMKWWCEGRIDTVLGYSDETLRTLRQSGCVMIFFGVESGSDEVLRSMRKQLKSEQILALAKRIREFDIVPEYSFIFGNPDDAVRDTRETIAFIRKVKRINPDIEIVVQTYVPTPQRDGMYGKVDGKMQFPTTPEEWATDRWYNFTVRTDPQLPWLPRQVKQHIDDFETVMRSRWPTIQDMRLPGWGRVLLQSMSSWRYALGVYDHPVELEWLQKVVRLRQPRFESL